MGFAINKTTKLFCVLFVASLVLVSGLAGHAFADVTVNILAVNGTDDTHDKKIEYQLPVELNAEDIIDTDGLKVTFDVGKQAYVVHGEVTLGPKETKTFKVRLRDIWRVDPLEIEEIKKQIDDSVERLKTKDNYDVALKKQEKLKERLDFIIKEQDRLAESVGERIDSYRIYSKDLDKIRTKAMSATYWRSKLVDPDRERYLRLIVELENSDKKNKQKIKQKHYVPSEVKPENFVDTFGFEVRFDPSKKQIYLEKEEELNPGEKKRYEFSIRDVWYIFQQEIENLRDRAREAYKLLKPSEYAETAEYLILNVKSNLEKIEISQAQDKPVQEHISAHKTNVKRFKSAANDVAALEDLLMRLQENLERSRLRNVLQKIKKLKSIADIAEAIIGAKPTMNNVWKIIIGIVTFVALLTGIHFTIWKKRSLEVKFKEDEEASDEEKPKE